MVSMESLAHAAGMIASVSFFIQYLPQAWLNYQRKSVKGFSTSSIVIKLIGASFLFINAMWTGEQIPVVCYGLFNVVQHSIFMIQFYLYSGEDKKTDLPPSSPPSSLPPGHPHYKPVSNFVTRFTTSTPSWLSFDKFSNSRSHYLLWILFPCVPIIMASLWPWTIKFTNSIKPIGQIASHIPQIIECCKLHTTLGISMSSQHLNFLGGACGMFMCWILPPKYNTTYLIYANSVFQAVSLYGLAFYYREPLFPSFGKESSAMPI